jgi:hypothetical protein
VYETHIARPFLSLFLTIPLPVLDHSAPCSRPFLSLFLLLAFLGGSAEARREDRGPGKFTGVDGLLASTAGQVWTVDQWGGRASRFDSQEKLMRTHPIESYARFGKWPTPHRRDGPTFGRPLDAMARGAAGTGRRAEVFDTLGVYLGEVRSPIVLDRGPLIISDSLLIGIATDSLDMQYVRVRRIRKVSQ